MVKNYIRGLRGKLATPVFEPTPLKSTHQGGQAQVADDWMRFERFLMIGTDKGTYYVGEARHTLDNLDVVRRCVAADGTRAVRRIVEISESGRAPKQDPCIAAFALASVEGDAETKRLVYREFGRVLRIPTHQMHFAAFREAIGGGWGAGLRRACGRLFNEATPSDLAYDAVKYQSRDGWALWDLLRLARPTPADAAHDALFRYLKDGTIGDGLPAEVGAFLTAVARVKVMANQPNEAAKLIVEHRIPREAVPSELLRERVVWEALLPSMGITALLRNLGNLAKCGALTQESEVERFVNSKVQDADVLRKGRVHPISVLAALKVYEAGRGVKGDGTWVATRRVVTALNEAFYACYRNVQPTGKRVRIALDISSSMIGNKVVGMDFMSARELEAAMLLAFLNVERRVDVVGFSHLLVDLTG
jgi:60 kDa SS-A/Ro ribonucleoprotein